MNTKIKAISEGAMMLALMGVALIIDRQFAGMFELLLYFLSIPVVVYVVKHGVRMGVTLTISASILAFLFSTFTGWFYTVTSLLIGLVYGYGLLKEWKNGLLLTMTLIANVIITFITVILFANIFGYDIASEMEVMMSYFKTDMMGLDIEKVVLEIIILSYMAVAFMQSVVTHLLCISILQRLNLTTKTLQTIFEVKLPKYISYLIVLVLVLYVGSSYVELNDFIRQCLLGLYTVAFMCAVVDGCITVMCFMRIMGRGRVAIFFSMVACMIPLLNTMIALIGIFDIHEDFRSKLKEGVLNEISRKD